MRLKENQTAIDFTVQDFNGNTIRLQDCKGKKTLLAFFRFATCPTCNLRLHELITNFHRMEARGLSIIAVFESSVENVSKYAGKQNAPFPIVADPEQKLYAAYSLEKSTLGLVKVLFQPGKLYRAISGFSPKPHKIDSPINRLPADFLIDENLVIRKARYGADIGDHIPDQEIYDFLNTR